MGQSAELNAAGITDPELRRSFAACRALNSRHGRTYYLATLLLPAHKRPFVHALYGFARYADDIVDSTQAQPLASRRRAIHTLADEFMADLNRGHSSHPVAAAAIHTAIQWQIPADYFAAFLDAMQQDLDVSTYDTFAQLQDYMYGSAAVIGLQMLPILGSTSPAAGDYAVKLGYAFQLANFIRDVGEDLDRGRVYLPQAELARFGVTTADLQRRVVTDDIRAALAFQVQRVRDFSEAAQLGIELLDPTSQPCIETARVLYCGIVDAIEAADYDVFSARVSVGLRRRLAVALPGYGKAWRARHRGSLHTGSAPSHPQAQREHDQREPKREILNRREEQTPITDQGRHSIDRS